MKILFVTYTTCARAFKEAMALMGAGHTVHVLQQRLANNDFTIMLGSCSFYDGRDTLRERAKAFKTVDAVHIHNEPDWMIQPVREALPDVPIVYDCHDLESQRNTGGNNEDECKAFELADAFIFPSKSYQGGAMQYHDCDKPSEVVYTYANRFDIRNAFLPRIMGGIVYEGGAVAEIEGFNSNSPRWFGYRDYWHTANYLSRCGIPFGMVGVKGDFLNAYLQSGAIVFPYMDYNHMINQLSRFDWGFVGHPEKHDQWEKAMPNKLFEYLAAGLPVLCLNAGECAEFIGKHKVGLVVDRLSDIPKLYNDKGTPKLFAELKKNVMEKRGLFIMDNQVEKIEGLYKEVCK